jgi:hypothetical protein
MIKRMMMIFVMVRVVMMMLTAVLVTMTCNATSQKAGSVSSSLLVARKRLLAFNFTTTQIRIQVSQKQFG